MRTSTHFQILGRYLGYPSCCVRQFCADHCQETRARYPSLLLGLGYVPCLTCAEGILKSSVEAFVAREITPWRVHSEPFPLANKDVVEGAYAYHFDRVLPAQYPWLPSRVVALAARQLAVFGLAPAPPVGCRVTRLG